MPRITPLDRFLPMTEREARTLRYLLDAGIMGGALPARSHGDAARMLSRLATTSEPNVLRVLDVSTGHLTAKEQADLEYSRLPGQTAISDFGGYIATALFDPAVSDTVPDGASESLLAIVRHAQARGCSYVLFDADAPDLPGFPMLDTED